MNIGTSLILLIALVLAGCVSPPSPISVGGPTNAEIYASPGWQANTVTTLAFDLKEDGKFDFVWPVDVPTDLRQRLEMRAIYLQDNWDGE